MSAPLPIDKVLPELITALATHPAAVLEAPPGAGKTTRVPLALLDQPWLAGQSIIMLEPRRLAATNAARFMARLRGEEVGQAVGYVIRYERKVSRRTRIEVVTEGILTRRLQSDPELAGVGLVIFDEFHERNLNSDLALALCRDAQLGLRSDLKLLVMSATLDAAPVAQLLGGCPRISSTGRSFPVEVRYLPQEPTGRVGDYVPPAIRRALGETRGDLLVFLPGSGEIRRCAEQLADLAGKVDVRPLYGDLPFAEQERAILPGPRRKVVLATNIAETSLTIEGVAVVVDAGFERRPRFDAARGMTSLEMVRISRASAEQRAGRAGRLGPGVCYRLWTEGSQGALLPYTPPEIRGADLAPLALELAHWGVQDASELAWLDPPPAGHLAGAHALLHLLGALDGQGRLTSRGEAMAQLPAHPRLSRLLLAAQDAGVPGLGADLAALLGERDLAGREAPAHAGASDLLDRLELLRRRGGEAAARAARYWREKLVVGAAEAPPDAEAVGRLLAAAFPDRIGREREPGSGRYLFSGGFGGKLSARSALKGGEWLVAVEVTGRPGGEGAIDLANRLRRETVEELFGRDLAWEREVDWDERAGRVVAREVRRLGALLLQERPVKATPADTVPALLAVIRRRGLDLLDWNPAALQLRARAALVAAHRPGWPNLSDAGLLASLEAWLAPHLAGTTTLAGLRKVDLWSALQNYLGWQRQQELSRLAPERLSVPSGSAIRLDYAASEGPVLACKLQELFGLAATPAVVGGTVPVLIHLLSPAGRPLAVTRDLRSFWDSVYPEVKKEMKGRYPRHPWPDDPWNTVATRRVKKRT
ncbi:ATP-dependent helicase HrpB [Desulfuromonas carbonis]|uniref:ATP-dependent helicase HrpB n=1 Tax=Desulfuromonas sp. DDH964 TaxID=1823759 RepID=UPI00078D6341|nr:ATP-dependent helicase HrpB [Desulfuromonas sp. DDH964]AMV72795.1 ATP-dependent helicase HrpB [Desulfuromonas sp. DDH964]